MAYNTPYNVYPSYNSYGFGVPSYLSGQNMMGVQSSPYNIPQTQQQIQQQNIPNNTQQATNTSVTQQQNQPAMNQNIQMNPMQGLSSFSRVVASREESSAIPADFSGAPIIMPMIVNGEVAAIYVKQWDLNRGQANFAEFYKQQPVQQTSENIQQQPQQQVAFATMDNIQNIQNYIKDMQNHIEELQNEINNLKNRQIPQQGTKNAIKKEKVMDNATD